MHPIALTDTGPRGRRPGVPGPIGILHPFPSLLDGAAAAALALLAGGTLPVALAAGAAMTLIQTSIGAVNDLADVDHDRVARPQKALVSGRIPRGAVLGYATVAALSGLALAFGLDPLAALLAAGGLTAGLAYDVWLNRTAWSWVPYAVGLPLLPAYAWAAAVGRLPAGMPALVGLGAIAGAALSLGNGLVDLEDDRAVGRGGLALRLGAPVANRVLDVLYAVLVVIAAGYVLTAMPAGTYAEASFTLAVPVIVVGALGSRSRSSTWRERAWEAQGIGVVLLALAWLAAARPPGT